MLRRTRQKGGTRTTSPPSNNVLTCHDIPSSVRLHADLSDPRLVATSGPRLRPPDLVSTFLTRAISPDARASNSDLVQDVPDPSRPGVFYPSRPPRRVTLCVPRAEDRGRACLFSAQPPDDARRLFRRPLAGGCRITRAPPLAQPPSSRSRSCSRLAALRGDYRDRADRERPRRPRLTTAPRQPPRPRFPTRRPHYPYSLRTASTRHHGMSHTCAKTRSAVLVGQHDAVTDARCGGRAAWVTPSARARPRRTMFWPGSEAHSGSVRPSLWRPRRRRPADARCSTPSSVAGPPEAPAPLVTLLRRQGPRRPWTGPTRRTAESSN